MLQPDFSKFSRSTNLSSAAVYLLSGHQPNMETPSNGCIFICGESSSCDDDSIVSTKNVLLANLASNWPIRTHHYANGMDPRSDKETLFNNIATSYAFLFIFSEQTTMNAFYLNQLGIAFACGVPVVGVREPSYIMPNPLPEYYYSTEVVDLTESGPSDTRNRPNARYKAILANLLVESFRNAVVYTTDFHKSCLERLFRKVTDAYSRSEKARCFPPNVTVTDHGKTSIKGGETNKQKVWTTVGGLAKCTKCGHAVKTQRKTSILRKSNSVDNLFKKDAPRPAPRRQLDAPQLKIKKSILQPVIVQPNFSKTIFQAGTRRPATSVTRQTSSAKVGSVETRMARYDGEPRPLSSKSCDAISNNSSRMKHTKQMEVKTVESGRDAETKESYVKEEKKSFTRRKTSNTGFITNRRGALLRKMSSLPCIPTTYLVTDPGSDERAFVKYPPDGKLTDDAKNVPEFTDDEDKETIHISRRPSPAISTCSTNIE